MPTELTLEESQAEIKSLQGQLDKAKAAPVTISPPSQYIFLDHLNLGENEKQSLLDQTKSLGLTQDQFSAYAQQYVVEKNNKLQLTQQQTAENAARFEAVGGEDAYKKLVEDSTAQGIDLTTIPVTSLKGLQKAFGNVRNENTNKIIGLGDNSAGNTNQKSKEDAVLDVRHGILKIAGNINASRNANFIEREKLMIENQKLSNELGSLADSHSLKVMNNRIVMTGTSI